MKKILVGIGLLKFCGSRFMKSAGTILNLYGSPSKENHFSNSTADILAIKNDWYAVGGDMRKVISDGR